MEPHWITLESEIGKGSTFIILLPIIKSLDQEEETASSQLNNQFISGDRIVQAVSNKGTYTLTNIQNNKL